MQAKEVQWVLLLLMAAVEEEEACFDTQYCRKHGVGVLDFRLCLAVSKTSIPSQYHHPNLQAHRPALPRLHLPL